MMNIVLNLKLLSYSRIKCDKYSETPGIVQMYNAERYLNDLTI